VWYFTDGPQLSRKALEAFERTIKEGLIIVPSVVLAEIMYIAKKGKITLGFEETMGRIEEYENFDIAPPDVDILRVANQIELDMEMDDRLIMATAIYFDAILITRDEQIKGSALCPNVW